MLSDSASLILSTTSTVNPVVFANPTTKSRFSFNINLKNVMGEMWNKYDQFALKVVSFSTVGSVTLPNNVYGTMCWNLRGLEWVNIFNENTGTFNNQQWAPIVFSNIITAVPTTNPLITNTGQSYNFKKGNEAVTLDFAQSYSDTSSENGFSGNPNQLPVSYIYNDIEFHFLFEPVIPGKMNECACFLFNNFITNSNLGRVMSSDRKIFSYPNFNMQKLCSMFWDKHTDFEIQMAQSMQRGGQNLSADNRVLTLQMSGLNFVNNGTKQSNAETRLNLSTDNALLGTLIVPSVGNETNVLMSYPVAPVQFKKDQDTVPLTITYKNIDNRMLFAANLTSNDMYQIVFFVKPIYGVEKGTLNLSVGGLSSSITNPLGFVNADYTTATWKNVNIKQVCRSMWDKYDRFNIFLTQATYGAGAGNATNAACMLQLEGFDLINQLSLTQSNRQNQVATLGSFYMSPTPSTDPRTIGIMSSAITTFYKKDFVDLTLNAIPLGTTAFSSQFPLGASFTFTIVGVPKDKEEPQQLKENRMF